MGAAAIVAAIAAVASIAEWTALRSAINGGKTALTLSIPFNMTNAHNPIYLPAGALTIVGNGAVFESPTNHFRFFDWDSGTAFAISNVTFKNGNVPQCPGGAILVRAGSSFTATNCTFSGNGGISTHWGGNGGAIFAMGGETTLTSCTFIGNNASYWGDGGDGGAIYACAGAIVTATSCTFEGNVAYNKAWDPLGPGTRLGEGGALYFEAKATGLLKNCSFNGRVSAQYNDIARADDSANVTFSCADGFVGSSVQMQGNEITVIPPKELQCTAPEYICIHGGSPSAKCVLGVPGLSLEKCQQACLP
jgi:hypothetical protein